jgi:hypothetical protein
VFVPDPVIRRDELDAAIKARRELGDEYEPQVVDSFIERVERRIEEQLHGGRPARREEHRSITPLALGSIALGIPITAVALSNAPGGGGIVVAIIAWIAIALINIAAAYRR